MRTGVIFDAKVGREFSIVYVMSRVLFARFCLSDVLVLFSKPVFDDMESVGGWGTHIDAHLCCMYVYVVSLYMMGREFR